jgi:hypothetical protein
MDFRQNERVKLYCPRGATSLGEEVMVWEDIDGNFIFVPLVTFEGDNNESTLANREAQREGVGATGENEGPTSTSRTGPPSPRRAPFPYTRTYASNHKL